MSSVFLLIDTTALGSGGLSYFSLYGSPAWCLSHSSKCHKNPGSSEEIWPADWRCNCSQTTWAMSHRSSIPTFRSELKTSGYVKYILQFVAMQLILWYNIFILVMYLPTNRKGKNSVYVCACRHVCGHVCRHQTCQLTTTIQASKKLPWKGQHLQANSPEDHKADRPQSSLIYIELQVFPGCSKWHKCISTCC